MASSFSTKSKKCLFFFVVVVVGFEITTPLTGKKVRRGKQWHSKQQPKNLTKQKISKRRDSLFDLIFPADRVIDLKT
jgi:hypothetical protein